MKTLQLFVTALIAFVVASCSSKPQLTHMPAKADGDSNWGLVDANGEFLISDEFDHRPSPVINGLFYVKEDGGISVYKADKKLRTVGDLVGLKGCGYLTDGLMPIVRKDECITFVDAEGKTQFVLKDYNGVEIKRVAQMFMNGLCPFMTIDEKWGAIDTNGNVVIEPLYRNAPYFSEDVALVVDAKTEKLLLINRSGKTIKELSDEIRRPSVFASGYAVVRIDEEDEDSRYAMVDTKGEIIKLPTVVDDVESWNDKYIVFENSEGDYGLLNYDGEILIRAKYDNLEILANGQILGERSGKFMFVTEEGESEKLPFEATSAIEAASLFSTILDFKFELISEDYDDMRYLRNYAGEKGGKMLGRFRGEVEIETVYSDYYDYDAALKSVTALFDDRGLKGYPFGSTMGNYADSGKSKSWYRGDKSMSVDLEGDSSYFRVSSATIKSNNNVVYDATPYASYYTWEFNNDAKINSISVTLEFAYDKYREDFNTYVAEALTKKFNTTVGTDANFVNNVTTNGYDAVTISLDESVVSGTEVVEDCVVEVDSCAVDTVVAAAY